MLTNNVKLLGQMIGNLLLPVVAKILPYINAFVIALQRLFTWLGKVLGIDLSKLTATKKNSGGDNSPISDILDDAEDLSGALDDDADSAKKLKKQLQGFDALNNLTTKEDKTKGLDSKLASGLLNDAFLDAVEDYLKAWQDAFDKLENKAEKIADKIQKFFMDLIYPIRKAWQAVGKDVVGAWKKAFKSVGGMLKDIGRDFMKMWHEKETILLFRNIFDIIKNIGLFISGLADRFREAWNYNETGLHIFEALRDILLIITDHIRNISDAFVEWAEKLDLRPLLSQMLNFLESIKPVADAVWGAIEDFYTKVLLPLGKWVLEDGLPRLLQVFIDFNNNVDWKGLRQRLAEFWEHLEPFAETVGEGLIVFVKDIADALKDFLNGDKLNDFLSTLEEKMDGITARDVANTLEKLAKGLIAVKIAVAGFGILSGAVGVFKTLIEVCKGIKGIVSLPIKLAKSLHTFFTVAPAGVGATAMMTTNISSIGATFTEIAATAGTKVAVASAGATIGATLVGGIASAIAGFKLGKFIGKAFTDDDEWYDSFKWTGEGGFFDSLDYFVTEMIPSKMDELKGNIKIGIGNAVVGIMEKKSEWDGAIEGFKTDTALKTAEIVSEFVQFKENVATSLGDMAVNAGVKLAEASDKFAEFKTNVSNHVEEAKANVSAKLDEWKAKFTEWKENLELKVFDAEIWRGILDKIRQGASKAWTDLTNWWNNTVVKKLNEWVTSIKKKVDEIKQYFRDIKNELKNGESLSWQMPWNRNTRNNTVRSSGNLVYANGGFPEDGMFFANHNELVGKFSNGKTAVANNDQIVSGIENGVYGAMSESNSLLEEQNSLLRALLDKETGIKASDIFDSVMSSADSYERQTGRKAFA